MTIHPITLDAIEATTNAVVGLGVSWALTYYALPLFGLAPSAAESGAITSMYFCFSFARAWAIRAAFRRINE